MNKLKNITRMLVVALQFQIASSSEPEQRLESHFEGNFHGEISSFSLYLPLCLHPSSIQD